MSDEIARLSTMGSAVNGAFSPWQDVDPNASFISQMDETLRQSEKRPIEGTGGGSGGSQQNEGELTGNGRDSMQQPGERRKRFRHTAEQIEKLELVFKTCPIPDDEQRLQLSKDLGLELSQVRYWFQNRRMQKKGQQVHDENVMLKMANQDLRIKKEELQGALKNLFCPNCSGRDKSFETHQLLVENARLREEFKRVQEYVLLLQQGPSSV